MNGKGGVGKVVGRLTAIVFCVVFLIFCLLVAFVSLPKGKTVDIYSDGENVFNELGHLKYIMPGSSYEVLNEFGEYETTHSTFFYPVYYYYFNILVTDESGNRFIMSARCKNKTDALREGKSVDLYGMISSLNDDMTKKQSDSLSGYDDIRVYAMCLNDNDDTYSDGYIQSIVFIALALLDLFLIYRIFMNR